MGFLDKLFGKDEADKPAIRSIPPAPGNEPVFTRLESDPYDGVSQITFTRYNDNNKTYGQTQSWHESEDFFKEKKYPEAFDAFFKYIANRQTGNVIFHNGIDGRFTFELSQGSKKIYGENDGKRIIAHVPLALMDKPGIAVMRRLLDLNYLLYYCRCAMNEKNELCMMVDFTIPMASPTKLYYGLRELATRADRLDDQLLADFTNLKPTNDKHLQPLPQQELDVKYTYFRQWVESTLKRVNELNQDSFSGAIAYLMLTMLYRIEFLLVPEGSLLMELERISGLYWNKKDEIALVERNKKMKDAIEKLLLTTKEDFTKNIYRTNSTFAVASPPPPDKVRENIQTANRDAAWYMENKYPDLALVLTEYGIVYSQFAFSIPLVLKDLSTVYMAVANADFFKDLGMKHPFYNPETKVFDRPAIEQAVDSAIGYLPDKYTSLQWDHSKINYDSLYEFGISFTNQLSGLNLDLKK